jgi:hypothetical protein
MKPLQALKDILKSFKAKPINPFFILSLLRAIMLSSRYIMEYTNTNNNLIGLLLLIRIDLKTLSKKLFIY